MRKYLLTKVGCHASESWHPEIDATTLDASFRWHDKAFLPDKDEWIHEKVTI